MLVVLQWQQVQVPALPASGRCGCETGSFELLRVKDGTLRLSWFIQRRRPVVENGLVGISVVGETLSGCGSRVGEDMARAWAAGEAGSKHDVLFDMSCCLFCEFIVKAVSLERLRPCLPGRACPVTFRWGFHCARAPSAVSLNATWDRK